MVVRTCRGGVIVGVVGDTKKEFSAETVPDVYVPYSQNPRSYIGIVARTNGDVAAAVEPVRRGVAAVDPSVAHPDVGSIEDLVAARGGQRRGLLTLLASFGTFALVLAALALYASLSYTVVQRRSELALRVAIGADARSILWLVLGEGLATALIGVVLGGAASLVLGRVLEHQLYGVRPGDPTTLVSIAMVLAAAAAAACAIPAIHASRTNSVLALRE
jgi:ABC-type antimicrobial peptide transport system permease subunit